MTRDPRSARAEVADQVAMYDHRTIRATSTHEMLAEHIWTAMYDLGAGLRPGGQWMAIGIDAEAFAGIPTSEKRHPDRAAAAVIGEIPVRTSWPHHDTQARLLDSLTANDRVECDVVIFNAPYNDVDLHSTQRRVDRMISDTEGIFAGFATTRPGGMLAVVVSTDWLDTPDPHLRQAVADHMDFLGAVRLPTSTLRQAAGTDRPVDLLLLRHRPHDQRPEHEPSIVPFQDTYRVRLDGHQFWLNEYFDAHPEHVLGRLTTERTAWSDGPRTTVLEERPIFLTRLEIALADITRAAHLHDLAIPLPDDVAAQRSNDDHVREEAEHLTEADRDVIRFLRAKRHGPEQEPGPPTVEDPFDLGEEETENEPPSL